LLAMSDPNASTYLEVICERCELAATEAGHNRSLF
jgi:hypothetical protein